MREVVSIGKPAGVPDLFNLILNQDKCEWKNTQKSSISKLHAVCSYMAMFPPSLPRHFINKYSKEGDIVLDIFSGRGTTVLEACLMNRLGIGNDLNPLAFVLTKAKVDVPQKSRIIARIEHLRRDFEKDEKIDISEEDPDIKMIFSNSTLKQLVFLKDKMDWKRSNIDAFITAMILGIIHGNSVSYLSLSMPNTFSMSPNYVKNFIAKHGLIKPERNAFDLLRRKLDRCYERPTQRGKSYFQDARKISQVKDSSVPLLITSPPYTRVIRYGQYNWIRLWFLGERGKEIDKDLFFSQSLTKYCDFMSEVFKESKRMLKPGAKAIFVIGDVQDKEKKRIEKLAEVVWERCAKPLGFKLVEPIIEDMIGDDTKVSKIWGAKKGNATKIDRILVLERN